MNITNTAILPREIAQDIFCAIGIPSLGKSLRVCKAWHTFLQNRDELWKELYVLMTGAICKNPPKTGWKTLFQRQYSIRTHLPFGNVKHVTLAVDGSFTTQQLASPAQLSLLSRQGIAHHDPHSGAHLSTTEKLSMSSFVADSTKKLTYRDFYPFKNKFYFQSPNTSITSCSNNRYMTTWSLGYKYCSFAIWDKATHQALFAQYNVYKPGLQVFDDRVVFQNQKMDVEIWNIPERRHLASLRVPNEAPPVDEERDIFLRDNRLFITYKAQQKTYVFDVELDFFLYMLKDSSQLFFTKNHLVTWNERCKVTLYPAKSTTPLFHLVTARVMPQILPDEDLLFAVAKEAPFEIGMWDLNSQKKVGSFSTSTAPIHKILLGSNRLVGISTDQQIFIWDIKSGQQLTKQPIAQSFRLCSIEHNILSFTALLEPADQFGLHPYKQVIGFWDLKTGRKLGALPDTFHADASVSVKDGIATVLREDPKTTTSRRLHLYDLTLPTTISRPCTTATHPS